MSDPKSPRSGGNAPRGSRRNQAPTNQPARQAVRPRRGSTGGKRQYMTTQQREAMYQRWLYIGLGIAAGLIVLSLGIGALWQYQIMPNQVLATVNGEEITRRDYWKYQDIALYNDARTYENMARDFTGEQQSQLLMYSAQMDASRKDVYGSTTVVPETLNRMIEDRLYVKAAEEQGVDMSNPVLMEYALNTFAPSSAPIVTPIPSPTMIPERAAWATETAEAEQTAAAEYESMLATEQAMFAGTPAPVGTATVVGTPGVIGSPDAAATPQVAASPVASPVAEGTPIASPVAEATPDPAVVRSNAESDYQVFLTDVLDETGLSEQEYLDLFAKPRVARDHIDAALVANVPQSAPMVEVNHIMVETEERANQLHAEITNGTVTFEEAAMNNSIDAATQPTGGKLGWVMEDDLPTELSSLAFSMNSGDISQPVQSPYGWHILQVVNKDDDRALSMAQYNQAETDAKTAFLEQAREQSEIESDHYDPVAEPTPAMFTPPVGAPTPVVATPIPAPDLSATPVSGPVLTPGGNQASPEASPAASPQASPEATP